MARKKPAAAADVVSPEAQEAAGQAADPAPPAETPQAPPPEHDAAPAAGDPPRSKWLARFNSWADHEAGVRLTEDRANRRMTIRFDEKPPEAVRKLLKEDYGYRFDGEDQVWYKPISPAKARQSRDEAEVLAFQAANLIRQDKGLEQKTAFLIGL